MSNLKIASALVAVALLTAACAAGVNPGEHHPDPGGSVAGFFSGFWHGLILFFTFIISLFDNNVSIYDVNNNGGWYDFGFFLGVVCAFGGGGASTTSR